MPRILVTLNQPVSQASLSQHLFFLVDELERLPITLEPMEEHPGLEDRQWRVRPVAEMPPDTKVHLKLKPGLLTPVGTKPGVTPRTVVEFYTFPTLRFLGIECSNNSGLLIRIYAPTSHSPSQGCSPLSRVALVFSSPVTQEMIGDHLVVEPGLSGEFGDSSRILGEFLGLSPNSPDNVSSDSPLNRPRKKGQEYKILLPQVLKAATNYHLRARASEILDEFGRPLPSDIDFNFPTNNRPPSLVMTHPISILERQVKTHLPVTLTNIEELDAKFQRLTPEGIERSQITVAVAPRNLSDSPSSAEIERLMLGSGKNSLTLPSPLAKPSNISYRFPLRVREWLKGQSGVLLGHLSTYPFTGPPRWFFSEVTPFHVHLKLGHDNSLVWVTDLATGKPVQGARVQIYRDRVSAMTARPTPLSAGMTREDGLHYWMGRICSIRRWRIWTVGPRFTILTAPENCSSSAWIRARKWPSFRWPTSFRYLLKSPTMTECPQGSSGCPDLSAAGASRSKASTGPETPSSSKFMPGSEQSVLQACASEEIPPSSHRPHEQGHLPGQEP